MPLKEVFSAFVFSEEKKPASLRAYTMKKCVFIKTRNYLGGQSLSDLFVDLALVLHELLLICSALHYTFGNTDVVVEGYFYEVHPLR